MAVVQPASKSGESFCRYCDQETGEIPYHPWEDYIRIDGEFTLVDEPVGPFCGVPCHAKYETEEKQEVPA